MSFISAVVTKIIYITAGRIIHATGAIIFVTTTIFVIKAIHKLYVINVFFLYHLLQMALDPSVWGPFYWFVLHTIALTYPLYPNETIKKKYYDFIQNLPLFLPVPAIGNKFSDLLDKYPVTPYLDSQTSFTKWMHFIHNKINISLNVPEITMEDAMVKYYEHYKPKAIKDKEQRKRREKYVFGVMLGIIVVLVVYLYKK